MATLPKGLDVEDCIEINVTSLERSDHSCLSGDGGAAEARC